MEVDTDYQFKTHNSNEDSNYLNVQQCIKSIIKREGFIKYSVDKKIFTPDGGNFLGILSEVDIKGETEDGKKETNLFLKIITPGEQMTLLSLPEVYKKELFVYNELSKIYNELQDEINLPQEKRFKMVKSYAANNPGVIVLENMTKKGYNTYFRMDNLTLQYAELAVKELAKFHALSFILEAKRPKYFEQRIKTMNQPFNFNEEWNGFVRNMCQITRNYLDKHSCRKFDDFVPTFVEKYAKRLSTKCGRDVLCHGDYRPNNILMKEINGQITDLIPIDYQLVYHGCPIIDFLYLIFPATDQEFRRLHLHYLKELYYKSLGNFLNYYQLDVTKIYPKHEFERHYKERLDYGLMVSINLVPFLMAKADDVPDITKGAMAGLNFNLDDKCRNKIIDLVNDFIDWGYL